MGLFRSVNPSRPRNPDSFPRDAFDSPNLALSPDYNASVRRVASPFCKWRHYYNHRRPLPRPSSCVVVVDPWISLFMPKLSTSQDLGAGAQNI